MTTSQFWTIYTDPSGNSHPVNVAMYNPSGLTCVSTAPGTYPINDGSGLSIVVSSAGTVSIQTPSGAMIQPFPLNFDASWNANFYGSAGITDNNGNQISAQLAGLEFVDTIGTAYSISGNFWKPQSLTYTDSNGAPQAINITWGNYTLQTNFGCTGMSESPGMAIALPQSIAYPDGSTEQFTYEATPGYPSSVTGRIASVTLRTGATISLSYTGGNNGMNCSDGTTPLLTVITADGSWTFQHASSSSTASATTVTDAKNNQMVVNFENGFETQRQVYQGSATGTPLQTITTCYNGNNTSCATSTIKLPITELSSILTLPNGNAKETDTLFNNTGGVTEVDESLWGVGGVGGAGRKTTIAYASLGNGILNRPATVTVYDESSGNQMSQTTYGYDETALSSTSGLPQHAGVSGARGNMTSVHGWLNTSGGTITTTQAHDDAGQLVSATDANGNKVTLSYGCNDAYPAQTTLPSTNNVSHASSASFDCNTGLLLNSTDQNNQTTRYSYDGSLRPTLITRPDGGSTTISYLSVNETESQLAMDSSRSLVSYALTDGYGRTSRVARANGEGGYDQQDFTYDADGLPSFTSYPYQGSGFATAKVTSGAGDSFAYDALGRITQLTHSDSTSIQYVQETRNTQITDEAGNSRIIKTDGLGRLANVCEITSTTLVGNSGTPANCGLDLPGSGFLTTYNYDVLNRLISVAQGGLNPRTYNYDSLSRLLSSTDPESGTTCYGTYSGATCQANGYDNNGNLLTATDPRGIVTSFAYDALNRITSKTYGAGSAANAYFVYDAGVNWGVAQTNMIGRLSEAWTGSSGIATSTIFGYDPVGRLIVNDQCTPLNCGVTSNPIRYTYDLAGDTTSLTSAGVTLGYSYNVGGRLTGITSSLVDATHPGTLLSNAHYNAFGERTSASYGNVTSSTGISESRSFDSRGRIQSVWSAINGGAGLEAFSGVTYTPNSLIKSVNDAINYGNWTYAYDNFNRLSSATYTQGANPAVTLNWTYDRYGNRWSQSGGTNNWSQAFDSNNRILSWSYDAAGDLLNDGSHAYSYDEAGRMLTVDGGAANGGVTYAYDAFGSRVGRTDSSGTHAFTYDPGSWVLGEYTSSGLIRGEIWGAGHIGTYINGQTFFSLVDWLGNERVKSTQDEAGEQSFQNLPFGDGKGFWGVSVGTAGPMEFTGDEHDSESNLDHTLFRQYSSAQGRWMTPDPLGIDSANLSDPQSLNQYAYAGNNPINNVDPLGLLDSPCNDPDFMSVLMCGSQGYPSASVGISLYGLGTGGGAFEKQGPFGLPPGVVLGPPALSCIPDIGPCSVPISAFESTGTPGNSPCDGSSSSLCVYQVGGHWMEKWTEASGPYYDQYGNIHFFQTTHQHDRGPVDPSNDPDKAEASVIPGAVQYQQYMGAQLLIQSGQALSGRGTELTCTHSPFGAVMEGTIGGTVKGAVSGAIEQPFGAEGAVEGAINGAAIGYLLGFVSGSLTAMGCAALGAYDK